MITLARTDTSVLGRWWWTVDRWSLAALGLLIGFGAILIAAASPPVATRIGLSEFHFVQRHLIILPVAVALLVGMSLLSVEGVLRAGLLLLLGSLAAMVAVLFVGTEIKGATRWIHLPGLTLQPSEFVKPAFAVAAAWLFSLRATRDGVPGYRLAMLLFAVVAGLLMAQPDFGMTVVVAAIFGVQFFLAGLPMILVLVLGGLAVGGLVGAYFLFPHVASRIDRFLDPSSGDTYQISRSLEAFTNGGLWGTGPGQGTVKHFLPDAHADFIFAVAGEEFGIVWCLVLVLLFGFVVLRGLWRAFGDQNLFVLLAASGILVQFAVQALINMASAVNLIPTKGMTLPFISYGGSSLLAMAIGMGFVLALTRRRGGGAA